MKQITPIFPQENRNNMDNPKWNDQLDMLKYLAEIQCAIKDKITSDFVLAKLTQKDKQGITEMTVNAYFSKQIVDMLKKKKTWYWNKETKEWEKGTLKPEEIKELETTSTDIFNAYMKKIYMVVILNRNISENYLIDILSGNTRKQQEESRIEEEQKGFIDKIKGIFGKEKAE